MTVPVRYLGLKLPLSHPTLAMRVGMLTRRERDALRAAEDLCAAKVVMPGRTRFVLGPESGFSRSYVWEGANGYVAAMTDADAARLLRGGIIEWWQFCRADDPRVAIEPRYPDAKYLASLVVTDRQHGVVMRMKPAEARTVDRLLRQADRTTVAYTPVYEKTIRIGEPQGLEAQYVDEARDALRNGRR